MNNYDFSKLFQTKTEVAEFGTGLTAVSQKIYETGFSLDRALAEQFGVEKKEMILDFFRINKVVLSDNSAVNAALLELQQTVAKLPVMSLTLAFLPKSQNLQTILDWITVNTKQQVILELKYDRSFAGGAIINYKGKYYDGSIKL